MRKPWLVVLVNIITRKAYAFEWTSEGWTRKNVDEVAIQEAAERERGEVTGYIRHSKHPKFAGVVTYLYRSQK